MRRRHPYGELDDIGFIGSQDRSPEQVKKDSLEYQKFFLARKEKEENSLLPKQKKRTLLLKK
ncbi:MAG: hypothetical protein ABI581_05665 [Sediminibacterium sp.]